jgi:hypothetical protein
MSDPENFLKRWSRRKQDAADENAQPGPPAAVDAGKVAARSPEIDQTDAARPAAAKPPPLPEFDLAKLPTIESIGANSDIRPFLLPGVPPQLKLAALRRAWSADPVIRDYIGPSENAWDFTDPNSMAGFGDLDPNFDVKGMLAQLFGEKPQDDSAKPAEPDRQTAQLTDKSTAAGSAAAPDGVSASDAVTPSPCPEPSPAAEQSNIPAQSNLVQREGNIASRDKNTEESKPELGTPRRPHGGALPQ